MSKVTSKYQVSVPRDIARALGIRPGDDLVWEISSAGAARVSASAGLEKSASSIAERLRLFDQATERQSARDAMRQSETATERGWRREELYER